MMGWFSWLSLLLLFLCVTLSNSSQYPPSHPLCHPHDSSALLGFKNSFSVVLDTSSLYPYCLNPNTTISWGMSRDCCSWSGVTCDEATGRVIGLHLICSGLQGVIDSNNSLFSLTHLQTLVLSINGFNGSEISANFGRFAGMIHLDLSYCGFTGQVPLELAYLSNLRTLVLTATKYDDLRLDSSSLKRIVANLTNLIDLRLIGVNMSGVLPSSFMNLSTSLTFLDLSSSKLQGEFPESIFRLPKLDYLFLSHNPNLIGLLPKHNWTSTLRLLSLDSSGFIIDLPHILQNLKYLERLYLRNCSFTGKFPAMLGNNKKSSSLNLVVLHLSSNNFGGTLPEICRNSSRKNFLCDPSNNQPVGPLPLKLQSLNLGFNLLHGPIPSWLYSLPSLMSLSLSHNRLTGQIEEFQFKSLRVLDLGSNKFQGHIPRSIFHQKYIYFLDLSSNNLSGVVKMEQFSKLKSLYTLILSFNRLSLVFKSSINYTLPNSLLFLGLSSCNISEFPYHLRSLENLEKLELTNNRIQGSVPKWFWNVGKDSLYFLNISHNFLTYMSRIPWKNLQYIDLRSNQLQGHLPIPPLSTLVLFASNNRFSGEISSSLICSLSSIQVLNLANNSLSGNIPLCIGNSSKSLSVLDLRMNKFVGVIPSAFAKGISLTTLNLNGNLLEGPLPRSIHNCKSLEVLDVGNNKLHGSFPQWLESLPELQVLILRSNRFHGEIPDPEVRFPFQKLRIVDFSDNRFTGVLPEKYLGHFVAMKNAHTNALLYMKKKNDSISDYYEDSVAVEMKGIYEELVKIQLMVITIDFSKNNFTGEIPELIGNLNSLKGLNLSHNKLAGPIPTSFGDLSNLEWLDLSSNELVGKIPSQLAANLYQLEFINLSNNHLEGVIPLGKQFNTFNNDSYIGNPRLCGFPLSISCGELTAEAEGDDRDDDIEGLLDWKIVMMGYACGVVIGVSLGYVVFFSRRFDYWLAKRIGRPPQRRRKTINARLRGRGRIASARN